MMSNLLGIIGGSGFYDFNDMKVEFKRQVETPFGRPSGELVFGNLGEKPIVFLPRHGSRHALLPHEVNYAANAWALWHAGCKFVASVTAVGSLHEEIRPGDIVLVDQVFDNTRDRRASFFEKGIAGHVSMADPVCLYMHAKLVEACENVGGALVFHKKGREVVINDPRFSTRMESDFWRAVKADVVGMTICPEIFLLREAEISAGVIALSTDYDCWHPEEEAVNAHDVAEVMKQNVQKAQKIVQELCKVLDFTTETAAHSACEKAVMTKNPSEVHFSTLPWLAKYF